MRNKYIYPLLVIKMIITKLQTQNHETINTLIYVTEGR